MFIDELLNRPIRIFYLATLSGLEIYQNVSLGTDYYLKKYDDSDFDKINEFAVFINQEEIHLPGLFILKMYPKITKIADLFELENHLLTIIRLFSFGEVYISYRVFFPERIIKTTKLNKSSFQHKKPDYIWTLPVINKDKLTDFATTLLPLFQQQLKDDKHKAIQFALERFDWSMRDDISIERRLLFAVMGLEPLFLPKFTSGKAAKLSQRVSKLLEEFDFDQPQVKSYVKRAYNYRNKIVHGSKYPEDWNKELPKLFLKILNYLRVSLIFFLLNLPLGRDAFAELIADSLASDDIKKKLQTITSSIKKRFDVCLKTHHHDLL